MATTQSDPRAAPQSFSSVPASGYSIISLEYDATGLAWADMWDNEVLSWVIDQSGSVGATPIIIGSLPPPAPDTDPVVSPQWIAVGEGNGRVIIPDLWRGDLNSLFTYLATNNGATRKLRGNFVRPQIDNQWRIWVSQNPDLVWDGTPPPE
jgi:hypothetical protein